MNCQQLWQQTKRVTIAICTYALKGSGISNRQQKKVEVSITLEQLNIKLFYQIQKTQKSELLKVKNHKSNWSDLLDEYWKLVDLGKYKRSLRKDTKRLKNQNKFITVSAILMKAAYGYIVDKELKDWGYSSVEDCRKRFNLELTKYEMEEARNKKTGNYESEFNVYRDALVLEQILDKNIDLDKCNVLYWIELNKLAKTVSDSKKKK